MKVILTALNAKYIHTNLAVRYLKSYHDTYYPNPDIDIEILESTINNRIELIEREIYLRHPDVIAFSCYIWNIDMVLRLCNTLKKVMPNVKIILGGPEVSFNASDLMSEYGFIDYIICGEGEKTFAELLRTIHNGTNDKIKGLFYRENNTVRQTEQDKPLDMSTLPFVYENELDTLKNRIIYYEASRGCPFKCSYCLSSAEKGGVRFAPIEKVKRELSYFLENNVLQVKFVDRTFNCNKKFAVDIINHLIKNDNGITNFHFEIEAFVLDDDIITLLNSARKGLFQLEIGVQSTNTATLDAVNRNSDFVRVKTAVQKLMQYDNIHIHLDLIAGLPNEDLLSFKNSFNDVFSLKPQQLQLGFLKMLNGSGIRNDADNFDAVYKEYPPYEILCTDCLSYSDILLIKDVEECVELYYNSGRFYNTLEFLMRVLICEYPTPFDFFVGLSRYINCNSNINDGAVGKLLPYKTLIDFVKDLSKENDMTLHHLARYDMLLHEKLNVVPSWLFDSYDISYSEQMLKKLYADNTLSTLLPEINSLQSRQLSKVIHIEKFPFDPTINHGYETSKVTDVLFFYKGEKGRRETVVMVLE